MIFKTVVYFGREKIIACDKQCEKAWGITNRPKINLSKTDEDDYAFLSDNELGIAPIDATIYEGGDGKPNKSEEKLNKWCIRQCERCYIGEINKSPNLVDFSVRVNNIAKDEKINI